MSINDYDLMRYRRMRLENCIALREALITAIASAAERKIDISKTGLVDKLAAVVIVIGEKQSEVLR